MKEREREREREREGERRRERGGGGRERGRERNVQHNVMARGIPEFRPFHPRHVFYWTTTKVGKKKKSKIATQKEVKSGVVMVWKAFLCDVIMTSVAREAT